MAHPGHQQRAVIRQLLHASRHVVKGAGHRSHFRCAVFAQRRGNNPSPDLKRRVLQVDQRSVLNTNKEPGAANRQQHDRQGVAEQRREIALVDFGQRYAHPDIGRKPGFQPHHGGAFVYLDPHFGWPAELVRHLLT